MHASGISIFGINFYNVDFDYIYQKIMAGGLLLAPSGPGLATIEDDEIYYKSLLGSDVAIFDSGFLCLLVNILTVHSVRKFSGYKFLDNFFQKIKNEKVSILTVEPTKQDADINRKYLLSLGGNFSLSQYIAPLYRDNIIDEFLLAQAQVLKPKIILINVGGGVQEPLGFYLKNNLVYRPAIICTGAAISFFTKAQAPISKNVDYFYLGWLIRCFYNPFIFLPRYFKAIKLLFIFISHKNEIVEFKNFNK